MSLLTTASLVITPNAGDEGTLYSVIPSDGSGDMSVVRATTATRVNSAGLVELVPYNLLQYSEQFNNGVYNQSNVSVTSNSTIAPNGTTTADTITDTASSGLILQTSASVNEGATVTLSQYCKRSNNDWIYLGMGRSGVTTYGEVVGFFNLATGATGSNITYGAGVFVSLNIENVGNGWYRCSLTAYVSSATAYVVYSGNANANGVPFVSDIGDARFQWGAQLVEGSTAKDYQRTETRLNIPRLDYSNGTCPSLLVEPQRTNLVTYSEQLDNVAWTKTAVTITANNTTAPNGILTADKVIPTNINAFHNIYNLATALTGNYSFSVYAKKGGLNFVNLQDQFGGVFNTCFDLVNGTFTSYFGTATMKAVGNDWFLCSVIGNGLAATVIPSIIPSNSLSSFPIFVGNNVDGIFIWGAQLEAGSYPTSYIPTTSASVTRNADVVSKTGISSLIGQTEGTCFVDFYNYGNSTADSNVPFAISNGAYGSAVYFEQYLGNWYGIIYNGFVSQFSFNAGTLSIGRHKFAIGYKTNDVVFYVDGNLVSTDTSATIPTCSRVDIGTVGTSTTPEELSVNATALWKTRLTNTQLAQLTTI